MADTLTNPNVMKTSLQDAIISSGTSVKGQYIKHFKKYEYDGKSKVVPIAINDTLIPGNPMTSYASIIPEKQNAQIRSHKFNAKTLTPKRFAEQIELSQEFADNSEAENQIIARDLAIGRFVGGMSEQILSKGYGAASSEADKKIKFELLCGDVNGTSTYMVERGDMPFRYEELRNSGWQELYKVGKLKGAFYILSSEFPLSVKDAEGKERLITDNSAGPLPEDAVATLDGLPVYRDIIRDRFDARVAWTIVNPNAYGMIISDVTVTTAKEDVRTALNATLVYTVQLWTDGVVLDYNAKRTIKCLPYGTVLAQSNTIEMVENPMAQSAMNVQSVEEVVEEVAEIVETEVQPKAKRAKK